MIIPNKLKNKSYYVYKNISIFDIIIGFVIFGISVFLAFVTNNFSRAVKIILFLVLFSIFFILLFNNKTHSCKNYVLLYRIIKFYFNITFHKGGQFFNIPYKHFEKDYLWTNTSKNKENAYIIGFLEIEGFDISIYDDEEIERCVDILKNMFKFCKTRISIIKLQDYLTIENNIEFFNHFKDTVKQSQKLDFLFSYYHDLSRIEENSKINKYYIAVCEKSVEKLEFLLNEISLYLRSCKLENKIATKLKVLRILNKINFLENFEISHMDNLDEEEFIVKHFRHQKIQVKPTYFVHKDTFYSMQVMENFHFTMNPSWAKTFFESESTVVWHLEDVSYDTTKKLLNISIIDLRIKCELEKNSVNRKKFLFELEALEELSSSIATGRNSLKNSTILFLTDANDKKKLQKIKAKNVKNATQINCKVFNLNFLQLESFQELFFVNDSNLTFSNEIPVDTIAESWPFYTNSLNDENLLLLGRTRDQNFLIWDQFFRDNNRKNFNMFILGTSGSGKSSLTKKILINHLVFNHKVIIIDPEREYFHLAKLFNGSWIELGQGRNTCINPLQIRLRLEGDDTKPKNSQIISSHVRWVELWFRSLYGDADENLFRLISSFVVSLYQEYNFFDDNFDFSQVLHEEFPTIQDLISHIEESEKNNPSSELKKLLFLLKTDFEANGKYFDIYNGATNVVFDNNLLIFDVQNLYEVDTNFSLKTAFLTILSLIQDQIASNYNARDGSKIVICIDEAHLLLDENNAQILNYLIRTIKRIRKYRGGIILTTQNPTDFNISVGANDKTQAIVNNMQYAVFLNMKHHDVGVIDQMFSHVGGLADYEKKFLTTAQVGQCIFSLDNIKRFILSINYNDVEKKIIFKH